MLIIREDRKDELEKYGFQKNQNVYGGIYYTFGKTLTIEPSGKLKLHSYSEKNQDVIHDLIKDGILEKRIIEKKQGELTKLKEENQRLKRQLEIYERMKARIK